MRTPRGVAVGLPVLLPALAGLAVASGGADNGTAAEEGLVFASADALFHCLGAAPPGGSWEAGEQEEAPLLLADCGGAAARWRRNLTGARIPGALEALLRSQNGSGVCAAPGDNGSFASVQLSEEGCGGGHLWLYDWQHRIQVHDLNSSGLPGRRRCLTRLSGGVGSEVALAPCNASRQQLWLALPKGGASEPNARLDEIRFPLRARGRRLVDAAGRTVHLRGVNWYGAHMEQGVNNGLDKQPVWRIARLIRHLGFNHVRLSYAVEMWARRRGAPPARREFLSANPELLGKTELEVFDAVVEALTKEGLLVIINSHTSDHRWCCSLTDDQGLWYNDRWPEEAWLDSLTGMARRYALNPRVLGIDPRNEPRPNMPQGTANPIAIWWDTAVWGNCTDVSLYSNGEPLVTVGSYSRKGPCLPQFAADWRKAATQGAYAIWHGNPEALVFVEGLGAAEVLPAVRSPMPFQQGCLNSRVVWSVHDYTWAWRWNRLGDFVTRGGGSFTEIFQMLSGVYQGNDAGADGDYAAFRGDRERSWAFLLRDEQAPVWVGEFGEAVRSEWWKKFIRYAAEMDLDWCYWALDAYKYQPGNIVDSSYMLEEQRVNVPSGKPIPNYIPDDYGLLGLDYDSAKHVWKLADLVSLQRPVLEGPRIPEEGAAAPERAAAYEPENCTFNAAQQPVEGTGPHPAGFNSFLATTPTQCDEGPVPRRLAAEEAAVVEDEEQGGLEKVRLWTKELSHLGNDPDARSLAALARDRRAQACAHVVLKLRQPRAAERQVLAANQVRGRNPVDEVLRSASPEEARAGFQRLIQAQMEALQAFVFALAVALPIVLSAVCILASLSPRVKRSGWRTPSDLLRRVAGCLRCHGCRASNWRPPVGVTAATAATKSWGPLLAVCYVGLAAGILAVAVWGLSGSVRVQRGVAVAQCAAMKGVDEALNGFGGKGGFLGLLPALAHIGNLTESLASDSPDWGTMAVLLQQVQQVPRSLHALRAALGVAAAGHFQACPSISGNLVGDASAKVEWSWARGIELLVFEVMQLGPKANKALLDIRGQLTTARERVQDMRDFLIDQISMFYNNDPLAWAGDMVRMALLTLMVVFFIVIIPTLLFSTVAVVLFIFPPESMPCCKRQPQAHPTLSRMSTLETLKARETWIRPHAAFIVWTTGSLFSVVMLGTSIWLHTSTHVSSSACTLLEDLTNATLLEYAPALGLPTNSSSLSGRATAGVITECFGKASDAGAAAGPTPGGRFGNVIEVRTCPAKQLPTSLRELMDSVRDAAQGAFHQAEGLANHDALSGDGDLGRLVATLGALSGCRPPGEQVDALRSAVVRACGPDMAEACAELTGSDWVDEEEATREAAVALAVLLQRRVAAVDAAVRNVTATLRGSLTEQLHSDILTHVVALTESLDCKFLRRAVNDAAGGLCFELVVGLIQLRNALLTLGLLCMAMAVMMYFLWLRLAQHRALVSMHIEGAKQARSGGNAVDMSEVSRQLAQGAAAAAEPPVTPQPPHRTPQPCDSPLQSPMESGCLGGREFADDGACSPLALEAQQSPVVRRAKSRWSLGTGATAEDE